MKKIIAVLLGAVLVLGLAAVPAHAVPAAAADVPGLSIGVIGYNAYGADVASNRNAEFVEIVADTVDVDLNGLIIQDAWARGNGRTRGCNTVRLGATSLPVAGGGTGSVLPAGKAVRVHMGAGTPFIDRQQGVYHTYANMPLRCGLNGHILNNKPGTNRFAPWDTVWITLGAVSESKSYNFSFGYTAG